MISRRDFLKVLVAGITVFSAREVFALKGVPSLATEFPEVKMLNMYNIHTGEKLDMQYYSSGEYDLKALDSINHFLRCHYTNEVREIDIGVIDLLCDIQSALGGNREIQIISGYRSPAYNHYLVSLGRNVSSKSLHMKGLAIDFTLDGISNHNLSQVARTFEEGGVGNYPDFVHIDVGRVRYW